MEAGVHEVAWIFGLHPGREELMMRLRLLGAFLIALIIPVLAIPLTAAGKGTVATSAQHTPVVAAQVGSASGAQTAASEGLPLLGLGIALIVGASLMRRLAPARSK